MYYDDKLYIDFEYPDTLDINDDLIITQINDNIYYTTDKTFNSIIYDLLDTNKLNILYDNVGKLGYIKNLLLISSFVINNDSNEILNNYNIITILNDIKTNIINISKGEVIDIQYKIRNDRIIVFYTVCYEDNNNELIIEFNKYLLNDNNLITFITDSSYLATINYLASLSLYNKYTTKMYKDNVNVYLNDVILTYNKDTEDINIDLKVFGLFQFWSYKINNNTSVIVNSLTAANVIVDSDKFKLIIMVYDKEYNVLCEKIRYYDIVNTDDNTEIIESSISNTPNEFIVKHIDDQIYIDNVLTPILNLNKGNCYMFNQYHSSNFNNTLHINNYKQVEYYLNNKKTDYVKYNNSYDKNDNKYIKVYIPYNINYTTLYYSTNRNPSNGIINII